jgi:hypothetical protein
VNDVFVIKGAHDLANGIRFTDCRQELVAEAEELMKTFGENPQFVEMMEAFRSAFGFEDKEAAQAAGRDNENRLSIARARLRKKLEAKRAAKK